MQCRWGHELKYPNLYPSGACRACARAKQYSYAHGLFSDPKRVKIEADIYYRLIMMGKGDKDRRHWSRKLRNKIYPPGYEECKI